MNTAIAVFAHHPFPDNLGVGTLSALGQNQIAVNDQLRRVVVINIGKMFTFIGVLSVSALASQACLAGTTYSDGNGIRTTATSLKSLSGTTIICSGSGQANLVPGTVSTNSYKYKVSVYSSNNGYISPTTTSGWVTPTAKASLPNATTTNAANFAVYATGSAQDTITYVIKNGTKIGTVCS